MGKETIKELWQLIDRLSSKRKDGGITNKAYEELSWAIWRVISFLEGLEEEEKK